VGSNCCASESRNLCLGFSENLDFYSTEYILLSFHASLCVSIPVNMLNVFEYFHVTLSLYLCWSTNNQASAFPRLGSSLTMCPESAATQ
jgi:hypothetical protein